MMRQQLFFAFILILFVAGCDEAQPSDGAQGIDANTGDVGRLDADIGTNGDAIIDDGDSSDGGSVDDARISEDGAIRDSTVILPDMGFEDECLMDNGSCGSPDTWRCVDHPDGPPDCNLIPDADYATLTAGVETIIWGGSLPDSIVIHGRNTFPVAIDSNGRAMIAAGRLAEGRLLHVTHESLMGGRPDDDGDGHQFVENSLRWLAGDRGDVILLEGGLMHLRDLLEGLGYTVNELASAAPDEETAIVILSSYGPFTPEFTAGLTDYVRRGGAVFSGGHAWWFVQSTGQDPATQYPGNALLDPMGLVIAGLGDIQGPQVSISEAVPAPVYHATFALDALRAHISGQMEMDAESLGHAANTVAHAIRVLPPNHPYFGAVQALVENEFITPPTEEQPLRRDDDPMNDLLVQLQTRVAQSAPANALPKIDAASEFPGDAEGAEPVIRVVTVDGNYRGRNVRFSASQPRRAVWRSTGLYARPGAPITVEFAEDVGAGLSVLVGCHTDTLWNKDVWRRYPEITRAWPITERRTIVGNSFGGPIYIRFSPGAQFGPMTATITGAIEMPLFRLGVTTARQWREEIRDRPAPWTEFASDRVVITLPSETIRGVDDPTEAIQFWSDVLDLSADLAAIDRERDRPERFVLDRQISLGSLHSGYPIMGHIPNAPDFIDIDLVRREGSWGPFHEIGHNHQLRDWMLPGTTEANVNLWSVYVSETALEISREDAHPALNPERRSERLQNYLDNGARFADWSVWTALETYLQLQTAFGWQFYQDLFAEYLDIPNARAPRETQDRIDEWIIRSSQRAGVNLIPFYTAWGLPISDRVNNSIGDLAEWLEDPMNPR